MTPPGLSQMVTGINERGGWIGGSAVENTGESFLGTEMAKFAAMFRKTPLFASSYGSLNPDEDIAVMTEDAIFNPKGVAEKINQGDRIGLAWQEKVEALASYGLISPAKKAQIDSFLERPPTAPGTNFKKEPASSSSSPVAAEEKLALATRQLISGGVRDTDLSRTTEQLSQESGKVFQGKPFYPPSFFGKTTIPTINIEMANTPNPNFSQRDDLKTSVVPSAPNERRKTFLSPTATNSLRGESQKSSPTTFSVMVAPLTFGGEQGGNVEFNAPIISHDFSGVNGANWERVPLTTTNALPGLSLPTTSLTPSNITTIPRFDLPSPVPIVPFVPTVSSPMPAPGLILPAVPLSMTKEDNAGGNQFAGPVSPSQSVVFRKRVEGAQQRGALPFFRFEPSRFKDSIEKLQEEFPDRPIYVVKEGSGGMVFHQLGKSELVTIDQITQENKGGMIVTQGTLPLDPNNRAFFDAVLGKGTNLEAEVPQLVVSLGDKGGAPQEFNTNHLKQILG